jgi:hypothetical protein
MRKRLNGAILTAAVSIIMVTVSAAWSQQRTTPPATAQASQQAGRQAAQRAARIGGHPNFNGIWQALNTANWNLEAHSAEGVQELWRGGAITAIPAGKSMLKGGGTIPYLPDAVKQRNENRAHSPGSDPEAKCYMLGIPRATYHNMPFQIFQGAGDADMLMVYPFAAMQRVIYTKDKTELPVDSWMGKSMAAWQGDTLVITTINQNGRSWLDRAGNYASANLMVTERFTLMDKDHIRYEATLDDPTTYSRPWTIEMPLYRIVDENAQLLEHKCVPFTDNLIYQDLFNPKP